MKANKEVEGQVSSIAARDEVERGVEPEIITWTREDYKLSLMLAAFWGDDDEDAKAARKILRSMEEE